jgi:hypothetical protein
MIIVIVARSPWHEKSLVTGAKSKSSKKVLSWFLITTYIQIQGSKVLSTKRRCIINFIEALLVTAVNMSQGGTRINFLLVLLHYDQREEYRAHSFIDTRDLGSVR